MSKMIKTQNFSKLKKMKPENSHADKADQAGSPGTNRLALVLPKVEIWTKTANFETANFHQKESMFSEKAGAIATKFGQKVRKAILQKQFWTTGVH